MLRRCLCAGSRSDLHSEVELVASHAFKYVCGDIFLAASSLDAFRPAVFDVFIFQIRVVLNAQRPCCRVRASCRYAVNLDVLQRVYLDIYLFHVGDTSVSRFVQRHHVKACGHGIFAGLVHDASVAAERCSLRVRVFNLKRDLHIVGHNPAVLEVNRGLAHVRKIFRVQLCARLDGHLDC